MRNLILYIALSLFSICANGNDFYNLQLLSEQQDDLIRQFESGNKYFIVDGVKYLILSAGKSTVYVYDGSECSGYVTIPSYIDVYGMRYSVASIGQEAFYRNKKIVNVKLPESITSIKTSAFCDCENLESIVLPDKLKYIGETAFYCCNRLTTVTIPANVSEVYNCAFKECNNLRSVHLMNNSFWHAGSYVFSLCPNLTSVSGLPNDNSLDNWFEGTPYIQNKRHQQAKKEQQNASNSYKTAIKKYTAKYGANIVAQVDNVFKNKKEPKAMPIGAPLALIQELAKYYGYLFQLGGQPDREYYNAGSHIAVYEFSNGYLHSYQGWLGNYRFVFRNGKLWQKTKY